MLTTARTSGSSAQSMRAGCSVRSRVLNPDAAGTVARRLTA
jgi:hypothetical protein